MNIKTIIIGVLALLCLIILGQNTQVVSVKLLFWEFSMSRIILLFIVLLIGFMTGFLTGTMRKIRTKQSKNVTD